jgi:hypothetical protein
MMNDRARRPVEHVDIDDAELARSVVVRTFIGIPLVFAVSTLLALQVGVGNALAIAVLPTAFSGSFVGGLILMMRALRRAEQRAAVIHVPDERVDWRVPRRAASLELGPLAARSGHR